MLVSILIPCFNAEKWVAQAIESALAQTWPEKEVIVVDDGSTDASLEIIRHFDGRVRWESGPNRGGNAARNRLLSSPTASGYSTSMPTIFCSRKSSSDRSNLRDYTPIATSSTAQRSGKKERTTASSA